MESKIVAVRYPRGVLKEVDALVGSGLYTNRSEFFQEAARNAIKSYRGILKDSRSSVEIVREIRKRLWEDALEKNNGNEGKALEWIVKEANKIEV